MEKSGTPTMGGVIILAGILVPTLLFAKLDNLYVQLMIIATVWLGSIGFIDDYIKVFKKNKKGLAGKFKVVGQIGVGLIVGIAMYQTNELTTTTIPFIKNNEFDYSWLLTWISADLAKYVWVIFIPLVVIIVTAVSNGANITDGLDGLATGTSAIIGTTLAIFAYLSGNVVFADYLNIIYIPDAGELVIFISSFVGACVGFLWYNSFPAKVFMGDTGSLALGGIIAVFAIAIRKELLIPVLRCFFSGKFKCNSSSCIFQIHQKIWGGKTGFLNVSNTSSFPEKRSSRV